VVFIVVFFSSDRQLLSFGDIFLCSCVFINACVLCAVVDLAHFCARTSYLLFTDGCILTIMAYALFDFEMERFSYDENSMSLGNVVRPLHIKIVLHPSCVFKNICGQRPLNFSCWN